MVRSLPVQRFVLLLKPKFKKLCKNLSVNKTDSAHVLCYKKDGQKLYQLARQGIEVEREARSITIDALELLHKTGTSLILDIVCSKGTYVRTLLEDIAAELGMCGTMSFYYANR